MEQERASVVLRQQGGIITMAEDRYEREERYGRDYEAERDGYRRPEKRSHQRPLSGQGRARPETDFERGSPEAWSTDDLGYTERADRAGYGQRRRYSANEDSYARSGRGYDEERGFLEKAGDEVASWLGDEDAEYRRRMDQFRGKGPRGYKRSDERIRDDVNDRLTDDGWLDASDIEVVVSSGEVTLTGLVSSRQDKRRAEDCADAVTGVSHVQNNLRVRTTDTTTGIGEL
ncbi:BON domain-containing protein [Ensifer sp. T173]|uniref:BON domain-containing protein n=2 Tax=Sinorhizobium/Ensifer group TaxID=227292 RepID=A0AAW4FLA2_9HYPH|nr:BON domain-containing protein [Ensifer canadensis]NOV20029.1 BON domain-containing protein [Ensifer canadensis]UBI79819.1 BON domain-containing protein [Ensifer canadensis]